MRTILILLSSILLISSVSCITITAHYPFDSNGINTLGIRGDAAPLSWTSSVAMKKIDGNTYTVNVDLSSSVSLPAYIHVRGGGDACINVLCITL